MHYRGDTRLRYVFNKYLVVGTKFRINAACTSADTENLFKTPCRGVNVPKQNCACCPHMPSKDSENPSFFGNFVDQYMSFIMRRKMEYSFCASSVDAKLGKVLCHNALLHTAKGIINGNNIFRAGCNIPTVYPEIFVEVFEGITAHIICGYIQDGNLVVVTNVVEGDANIVILQREIRRGSHDNAGYKGSFIVFFRNAF